MMDTTWYDGDWQSCAADSAEYYGIERVTDSGTIEEDHYRNGMLLRSDLQRVDAMSWKKNQL